MNDMERILGEFMMGEELGEEFSKILYDNLWELLDDDGGVDNMMSIPVDKIILGG